MQGKRVSRTTSHPTGAHGSRATHPSLKKTGSVLLSATLTASLACLTPAAAFATDEETIESWVEAASIDFDDPSYQPYSYATAPNASAANDATTASELPAKYDLRDPNGDGDRSDSVVTPVKQQDPWGTCWGFAAIAACETSILSELGKTYAETGLDLSELQLAGSVYRNEGAPERFVGADQAGEGYHNSSKNTNAGLNTGGPATYASGIFASGIGPLAESQVPYRNAEGLKQCTVCSYDESRLRVLTDEEITKLRLSGAYVIEMYWAGDYSDGLTTNHPDWSVSEDLWNASLYELESGNILPSTKVYDEQTFSYKLDPRGMEAVKRELHDHGRAVTAECNVSKNVNQETWAAFTPNDGGANHVVTIVGWDDSYSKDNFANDTGKLPDGDGAWLVKNSWGSGTESFPNGQVSPWGILENGSHTGYCWISYYDSTLGDMESFDFDVNSYGSNSEYYIDQYDYMPAAYTELRSSESPISSANIFTAQGDMALRTLGAATCKPNSTVTYQVYLLDDEAKTPTDPEHSTLVYSLDDPYQFGGYHRVTLPENDWIAMRKGQRYAVVTTQKCNDDGLYYQGAALNVGAASKEAVEFYRKELKKEKEQIYYDASYQSTYERCIAEGMSESEAVAKAKEAAETTVKNVQPSIEKLVNEAADSYANKYFVARVNTGESWTSAPREAWTLDSGDPDGETEWTDWSLVAERIKEKQERLVDNLSVKAFSELRSWASVDELDGLASAITEAKAKLAAAAVSDDGADVYACDTWLTQEAHDAAAKAIADAEAALQAAGDYRGALANTTPSSEEVAAATTSVAFEAHAGTKAVPMFPDVDYSEDCWYAPSVTWCAMHGMLLGYPDGAFGVGGAMSRAQLACALWRHFKPEEAADYDQEMATTQGTDAVEGVEDAHFYTAAANWAVNAQIIEGFECEGAKRDFAPYADLSFEQLVCIVAKASGADYAASDLSALDGFADKDSVSSWAAQAMAWAVNTGLVSGWDNGAEHLREIKPGETVSRERAAVVLARAFQAGVLK